MKTWANTLVKNEERYLWFGVTSVIDYVDKILIWDTGSTDNTPKVIKQLKSKYPDKVSVSLLGNVDINQFTDVRNDMLKKSKGDWLLLLDGDEVWWEDSIKEAINITANIEHLESIVSKYKNVIGDIYHFQEEKAGNYNIDGVVGHLTIRFMSKKIPGLHLDKPHGIQGFFDEDGDLIQNRDSKRRKAQKRMGFLHFTHMARSSSAKLDAKVPKRERKFKHEIGESFPLDYYYPEAFFKSKPSFVPSPWEKMEKGYRRKSRVYTFPKKIKRRIWMK